MSLLALIAAASASSGGGTGANPALTAWRLTGSTALPQNNYTAASTFTYPVTIKAESRGLRLAWIGESFQAGAEDAWDLTATVDGTPVTAGGSTALHVSAGGVLWCDDLDVALQPHQVVTVVVTTTTPAPPNVSYIVSGEVKTVPGPYAIMGKVDPDAYSGLVVVGDSIAAQQNWIGPQDFPSLNLGIPVRRWTSGDEGQYSPTPSTALNSGSHVLIQYGVNDIGAGTLAELQGFARTCWAWHAARTGRPIYQTTPTPKLLSISGAGCASSAGQTLGTWEPVRQSLLAWLRDGAPDTGGVRAGELGHPLAGIVDLAAAVESTTEPGKWDWTEGDLGGDGVHPSTHGQNRMGAVLADWLDTTD